MSCKTMPKLIVHSSISFAIVLLINKIRQYTHSVLHAFYENSVPDTILHVENR